MSIDAVAMIFGFLVGLGCGVLTAILMLAIIMSRQYQQPKERYIELDARVVDPLEQQP